MRLGDLSRIAEREKSTIFRSLQKSTGLGSRILLEAGYY
jgi:hypothetical protein